MKKIVKIIGVAGAIGLLYLGYTTYPKLDLISGFSAKSIASGHFIDDRSQELIEKGDNDIDLIDLAQNSIDEKGQFATASVKGLKERKAIYRKGLGAFYSSGSRPGMNAHGWAMARVNSFLKGGKARSVDAAQWKSVQKHRKK